MILDISEKWEAAVLYAEEDPMWSNSPNDAIDWKSIRSKGYTHVQIRGTVYEYSKHGLGDSINEKG